VINTERYSLTSLVFESTVSLYITTTGGVEQRPLIDSVKLLTDKKLSPLTSKLLHLNIGVTTGLYEPATRILVACSNHPRALHLGQFAEFYNILRKKLGGKERIEFVIASPKGGAVSNWQDAWARSDERNTLDSD
jgi:hypothetical protein